MSSFFTLPASAKKRKRPVASGQRASKNERASQRGGPRDDSISGSDASDDEAPAARNEFFESSEDDDDGQKDEDPAAKRIRLAEQYLANTQKEVLGDGGFDAVEVDKENLRRRMGERLKEDTAEGKGKLYRWIAVDLDWTGATQRVVKVAGKSLTGAAVQGNFVYTVDKDMALTKWDVSLQPAPMQDGKQIGRARTQPKRLARRSGDRRKKQDKDYIGHVGAIICVAVSQDGKFVATGGKDRRIVVWDAAAMKPLKVFFQHRDSVTSLAFRRGTHQLYSASRDRTVKIWSLDELAYVETLFGHQDEVVDVDALAEEKCVTVGARDRTARLWKVVEESQLVFRGGGAPSRSKSDRRTMPSRSEDGEHHDTTSSYHEGSIDRIACIDDETFVTGSDNGSLSLWNINKKKPVFVYPLAHGLEPPLPLDQLSAEEFPDPVAQGQPHPRWITALRAIPFSDVVLSGSWDGSVRVWRITQDKRRIEALGVLGGADDERMVVRMNGDEGQGPRVSPLTGVINDLALVDRGERAKEGVRVAAVVSKQHRLGRWSELEEARNSLVLFEVPRRIVASDGQEARESMDAAETRAEEADADEFAGFV